MGTVHKEKSPGKMQCTHVNWHKIMTQDIHFFLSVPFFVFSSTLTPADLTTEEKYTTSFKQPNTFTHNDS